MWRVGKLLSQVGVDEVAGCGCAGWRLLGWARVMYTRWCKGLGLETESWAVFRFTALLLLKACASLGVGAMCAVTSHF